MAEEYEDIQGQFPIATKQRLILSFWALLCWHN
jgi:hypothetical protein